MLSNLYFTTSRNQPDGKILHQCWILWVSWDKHAQMVWRAISSHHIQIVYNMCLHNVRSGWRRSSILPLSQLYHPVGVCLVMDECIVKSMFCQSCAKTLHVYATIPPGSCDRLIYSVRGRGGVWLVVFCSWMQKP